MSVDQCQFCKDHELTNEELIYQSDHDYPSDVESLSDDQEDHDEEPSEVNGDEKNPEELAAENALIDEIFNSSDEEEPEEDEDNNDPDKPKVRSKRGARWNEKGYTRVRSSYVRMPTGKKFKISTPAPKEWKCTGKSQLVEIRRFGKYKNEYYIVKKEMEKTKVYHPKYAFRKYTIIKIEKIVNGCLWKQYIHQQKQVLLEAGYANQRMLFHGSTEVDDLAQKGFNEQYANTNGMFGAGVYFAKHSSKANQYVFRSGKAGGCPKHHDFNCDKCERKMLLCRVTLGKSKFEPTLNRYPHPPRGYNSVVGYPSNKPGGLKYSEYIVYRREQAYPEYVITYKTQN